MSSEANCTVSSSSPAIITTCPPTAQLTLVNSKQVDSQRSPTVACSDDQLSSDAKTSNNTAFNPKKVESKKTAKNACLVCLRTLQNQCTFSEPSEETDKSSGKTSSELKLTLLDFCNLLQVHVPPNTKNSLKGFETPLCDQCNEHVLQIRKLLREWEEIEQSLGTARHLLKDTVVNCNKPKVCEGTCDVDAEDNVNVPTDILIAVHRIRDYIKRDACESGSHKKRGRKSGKKLHYETIGTGKEDTPAVTTLKDSVFRKSSFGRVVKRPRYYMMSDEESKEGDDVETKFDPNVSLPPQATPTDKTVIPIELVKVEMAKQGQSPESRDPVSVDAGLEGKTHAGNESQSNTSNENKIEPQNDDKDGHDLSATFAKKSQMKKITDRPNKFTSILTKRKKAVESLQKTKIAGTDKAQLGQEKDNSVDDESLPTNITEIKVETKVESELLKVKCDKCARTFSDARKKQRHVLRVHDGIRPDIICKGCDKKFSSTKELRNHRKQEHPPKDTKTDDNGRKIFKCDLCHTVFKNYGDLQIHHRTHTGDKPFKCTIDGCKEAFISKGRYEVHVEVKHPGNAPLKCEFCPRSFYRHHRLRDHKQSHTGEKPYLCEICSKAFTQPAYLKYHQTKHKELNLTEFKCDQCEKKFASPVNLKYHKETQHQKKYRYHCETCGHGATHMSHMKLHMRRHTGEKPHTCQLCQKSFTRKSQLIIHDRSHTGERPYPCTICAKSFTNSSKLRRHELTHSENKAKKRHLVQVTHHSRSGHNGIRFAHSANASGLTRATAETLVPSEVVDVQVDEDINGQAVLKLEQTSSTEVITEPDCEQQFLAINHNGVVFRVLTSEDELNIGNGGYAEIVLLNEELPLG